MCRFLVKEFQNEGSEYFLLLIAKTKISIQYPGVMEIVNIRLMNRPTPSFILQTHNSRLISTKKGRTNPLDKINRTILSI